MHQLLQLRSVRRDVPDGQQATDESGAFLRNRPHWIHPSANEVALMNGLINGLHESGAGSQQCHLERDVQEGITRTYAVIERGRKVEDGDGAF